MTLKNITHQASHPAWVVDAGEEAFFVDQPQKVRDALGDKATYAALTNDDGAGYHCHRGATSFKSAQIYDWFEDIINPWLCLLRLLICLLWIV